MKTTPTTILVVLLAMLVFAACLLPETVAAKKSKKSKKDSTSTSSSTSSSSSSTDEATPTVAPPSHFFSASAIASAESLARTSLSQSDSTACAQLRALRVLNTLSSKKQPKQDAALCQLASRTVSSAAAELSEVACALDLQRELACSSPSSVAEGTLQTLTADKWSATSSATELLSAAKVLASSTSASASTSVDAIFAQAASIYAASKGSTSALSGTDAELLAFLHSELAQSLFSASSSSAAELLPPADKCARGVAKALRSALTPTQAAPSSASLSNVAALLRAGASFAALRDTAFSLSSNHINEYSSFLVGAEHVFNVEQSYDVFCTARQITQWSLAKAVVVSAADSSLDLSNKDSNVRVIVSNIFGEKIPSVAQVMLVRAVDAQAQSVLANQELQINAAKEYELNMLATRPLPGIYTLNMMVRPSSEEYLNVESVDLSIKVVTQLAAKDLSVSVVDSADFKRSTQEEKLATFGSTWKSLEASVFNSLLVRVSVVDENSGRAASAEQVSVILQSVDHPERVITVAAQSETAGSYVATVNLRTNGAKVHFLSGEFRCTLLVGGAYSKRSLQWALGTVHITYPPKLHRQFNEQLVSSPRDEPLPEIVHQFRQPEERPAETISYLFTLLVLAPLGALLLALPLVGANLSNVPAGASFYAIGFQAVIGATMVLFMFYFLQLNMFQTLGYLSVLAVLAFMFGQRALRALYLQRKQSKKTKSD
eukprot:CAMPEP_0177632912 /NCGR_PEP_ID=MMETSP0447-20121125/2555_1 /TAXON_ID=0 /ORGANISM="Stygamoeba regulata, Strain BSH-02190019" /LENGTH=717 /DNA_ID=CAMNT_0019134533 /DNA_START=46 /DNA_END=2199 /DNA_ORIENTATION=-